MKCFADYESLEEYHEQDSEPEESEAEGDGDGTSEMYDTTLPSRHVVRLFP